MKIFFSELDGTTWELGYEWPNVIWGTYISFAVQPSVVGMVMGGGEITDLTTRFREKRYKLAGVVDSEEGAIAFYDRMVDVEEIR